MGIPPSSSAVQPPSGSDVLDLSRARAPGASSLFQSKSDEFKPLHIPPPMQVCSFPDFKLRREIQIQNLQIGSAANPLPHAPPPPLGPASSATPMLDLSLKRDPSKQEVKASPFSAEALLSRPSPKPQVCSVYGPNYRDGQIKGRSLGYVLPHPGCRVISRNPGSTILTILGHSTIHYPCLDIQSEIGNISELAARLGQNSPDGGAHGG